MVQIITFLSASSISSATPTSQIFCVRISVPLKKTMKKTFSIMPLLISLFLISYGPFGFLRRRCRLKRAPNVFHYRFRICNFEFESKKGKGITIADIMKLFCLRGQFNAQFCSHRSITFFLGERNNLWRFQFFRRSRSDP